jgi:hypothetical protein
MKTIYTLLLFCFFITGIKAQVNLVPNPSFEDTLGSCPAFTSQISKAKNWFRQDGGTPDYFNRCAPNNSNISIPNNLLGMQNTLDTSCTGYVGLIPYTRFVLIREFITAQLTNQLIVGTKYFVSFKVSLADEVTLASSKIGALFTTSLFNDTNTIYPINNFAHIYTDSIIKDKQNWTPINGSFIADSAYKYIILGNFFDQINTDTTHLTASIPSATSYYYIDDVCVSTDSTFCANYQYSCTITQIQNSERELFNIYPNPFSNNLTISFDNQNEKSILIFDVLGNLIFKVRTNQANYVLAGLDLDSGFYILKIFDNKTSLQSNYTILKTK